RFVVLALDWRGGGFHYFYNPNYGLRHHLVGCAAFRPYDEAELIVKLDRVDALILEMKAGDPLRGNLEGELRMLFSAPPAARLAPEFGPEPQYPFYDFAVFRKRPGATVHDQR